MSHLPPHHRDKVVPHSAYPIPPPHHTNTNYYHNEPSSYPHPIPNPDHHFRYHRTDINLELTKGVYDIGEHHRAEQNRQKYHHYEHHHDREVKIVPSNINTGNDCYCQSNWCCCFDRGCKLENFLVITMLFDAMIYTGLSGLCTFLILMWETTGRYAEERGWAHERYYWWKYFMSPNADGIYILLASYVTTAVAAWNLLFRYGSMKRCPAVWYLLTNVYATILQIIAISFFPFKWNFGNCGLMILRFYSYWVVWDWDMYIKRLRGEV